jgi:uncharacterized protein YjbI with pentapeptide repeats
MSEVKNTPKFSQEQYDMLIRCSKNKDMAEWNEWRKENPKEKVLLWEANLEGADLVGANLEGADLVGANLEGARLAGANLEGADLVRANLEGAYLSRANLEGARLFGGNLQGSYLVGANLEDIYLTGANLEGTDLSRANLQGAHLSEANLEGARLFGANLEGIYLSRANLEGADFSRANLEGADLSVAIVSGGTLFWGCTVDRQTKFEGVGLGNTRICPRLKQLLECNIRRMNWEEWYKKHPKLEWLVKLFWLISDYGLSAGRTVAIFFMAAFLFASIYYVWGLLSPPGIVENLFIDCNQLDVQWWLVPLRTIYFSIVTQTTLGFGDMYARAQSICGHILLSLQVLLGYVLLGALVTRFAVLFTAGGPAGEFAEKEKSDEKNRAQETSKKNK